MRNKKLILFIFLLFVLTAIEIPAIYLVPIQAVIFLFLVWWRNKTKNIYPKLYHIINIYLVWCIICCIRGLLIAENYTEYRQLSVGTMNIMLPLIVWLTYDPQEVSQIYRFWFKCIFPLSILILLFGVKVSAFISPLLLLAFLSFAFPKKLKWLTTFCCLFYIIYNYHIGDRVPAAKMLAILLFWLLTFMRYSNSLKVIRKIQIACYGFSLILFIFIMSDIAKVFIEKESQYSVLAQYDEQERIKDTRSLLYIDVINSAINEHYVLFGHTPARGNKVDVSSILFLYAYEDGLDSKSFNKEERFDNEALHLNIFTWLGLVGLILYSLIYFRASYLAVFHSNNKFMRLMGCIVALYWTFGFVETTNKIDLTNFVLWTSIGMCYSDRFRNMDNFEFANWCRTIVSNKHLKIARLLSNARS